MSKKQFRIPFGKDSTIDLDVDESVIQRMMSEEWQSSFYSFYDEEDAAEWLCSNLMGSNLSDIDGFADMDDNLASVEWW